MQDFHELATPPTLESELEVERRILLVKEIEDIDILRRDYINAIRANALQDQFISNCLDKIHKLTAKLACVENKVIQPKDNFMARLFKYF